MYLIPSAIQNFYSCMQSVALYLRTSLAVYTWRNFLYGEVSTQDVFCLHCRDCTNNILLSLLSSPYICSQRSSALDLRNCVPNLLRAASAQHGGYFRTSLYDAPLNHNIMQMRSIWAHVFDGEDVCASAVFLPGWFNNT